MCGRYSLIADLGELARRFEFDGDWDAFERRYNIAPTQNVLTVVGGESRRGGYMRWGLKPSWAKDKSMGSRMINARAETVVEKPSFGNALRRRRCLFLADGFYEWQKVGKQRIPMRIVMRSSEPFAFAGLWETWRDPQGDVNPSCTIITTSANDTLSPIHNRMPVILPHDLEAFWLDDSVTDPEVLTSVLTPYDDGAMEAYEVSTLVNSARNDGSEVMERVGYEGKENAYVL
ncbi:MAG: SOS response-associated peptidase [Chloroflexi bacterium]|nr:SOS response-associated peptidase [Chloroflexota bacterium]